MKQMLAVFLLLIPTLWGDETEASVLVADTTMSRMVELNADAPFCALYTDRGVIQKMILGADPKKVRQMSANLVADLVETCKASRDKGKNQPPGSGLMYPGTKWCGPGTLAKSYDDLGHHAGEDACCREHDHCPMTISPKECINGICNNSPFTRSHCDCDAKFRRCLQNLNTEVANTLGALFFNVIQVTCFKERRPCSQWQSCPHIWVNSRRYEYPNSSRDYYTHKILLFKTVLQVMRDILKKKQLVFSWLHMTID
ncbi:phospholipase A(2)-like isoform X1 [Bombus affinis]|uniref:phospholipase A(2)-like isoform X1 n=2 Tax=Bombus affinis TaxID=309941 RepID=UPI0021B74C22|nr:phospholipase A(2)-like isoform X1 [Bombus affinis]